MQSVARLGATRLVAILGVGAAMVAFFVFLTTRIAKVRPKESDPIQP